MNEAILSKIKYIQFPEEVLSRVPEHMTVEKLSLHQCTSGKISFHGSQWPNLRYIEIIGCSFLEIRFLFPTRSNLEQIYLTQCENIDFWEISGNFPQFVAMRIDASKYVKFKGEITGNIGLHSLEFDHALRSEIFQQPVHLPNLTRLLIQNGSNFFKLNLAQLTAPSLKIVEIKDSNYANIESMGKIAPQLLKFAIENCAYPKINFDFKKFTQLSHQTSDQKAEDNLNSLFNPNLFRKVKSIKKKKRLSQLAKEIYTDPNSPDLELYRNAPSIEEATHQANDFLNGKSSNLNENTLSAKFCPECGEKNTPTATFCSDCGHKFPNI